MMDKKTVRHHSLDSYRAILMELPDIVYQIDPDGYFRFLNNAVSSLGYRPEELIGKHFSKIVHPADVRSFSRFYVLPNYKGRITGPEKSPKLIDERRSGLRKTKNLVVRLLPKNSNKELRFGEVMALGQVSSVGQYKKAKKEFLGTLGVIRDITDQVRMDRQLHYQADMIRFVSDAIISTDLNLKIRTWNDAAQTIYGWQAYEVMDKSLFNIIGLRGPVFNKKKFLKKINQCGRWQGETLQKRKDGSPLCILSSFSIIKDQLNQPAGIVVVNHDITTLKRAEQNRHEIELRFRKFFMNASEYCYILSPEGKIIDLNRSALKTLGYRKKEVLGRHIKELFASKWQKKVSALLQQKDPKLRNEQSLIVTKSGEVRDVLFNIDAIKEKDGHVVHFIATQHDITGLNLLLNRLHQYQEVMAKTFLSLDDAVLILDCKKIPRILECNPATIRIFGYAKDEMLGRAVDFLYINRTAFRKFQKTLHSAVKKKGYLSSFEFEMKKKNGEVFPAEHSVYPLKDHKNKMIGWISVIKDITHFKNVEKDIRESEEKYRRLVENINDVLFSLNKDGIITYISPVITKIAGFSPDEIMGRHFLKFIAPEDCSRIDSRFKEVLRGKIKPTEYRIRIKSGGYRWVRSSSQPVHKDKKLIGIQGILTDITNEREAQYALTKSLKEKEILLREIHHRVKNNMQIMSSLLGLQTRFLKNKELANKFIEAQNRIKVMAFVHENLYKSQNRAQIDFNIYVSSLVKNLFKTYGVKPGMIKFENKIKDIFLNIETAIPCGLIINELISNALKYAFPDNRRGTIRIIMRRVKGLFNLAVEDNGIGFAEKFDFNKTQTLGLQLVRILTEQLNGSVTLYRKPRTKFLIKFKGS